MIDYAMMGGILLFLLAVPAVGAKYDPAGNRNFFGQQDSKAMRGFWCLIVVLVHIPQAWQNPIQDLIGSFAYIGVTFFFMTSAYGLSLSAKKRPGAGGFWIRRLPKLLIPNWAANVFFALLFLLLFRQKPGIAGCFAVNLWVQWLLACYLAFWIGYHLNKNQRYSMAITTGLVLALSGGVYYWNTRGTAVQSWCTESIGFIWGAVLFANYDRIKGFFQRKWFAKAILFCLSSLVLGVAYLLGKGVVFWGDYVLKILLGLSILCFILALNSRVALGNRISCFLGEISFEVYLVHGAVFSLIERLCPGIGSGLFILLSLGVSILAAAVIHKLSNWILRRFCC